MRRREFLALGAAGAAFAAGCRRTPTCLHRATKQVSKPVYEISLAQWSLHRTIFGSELDPMDFADFTRARFDLDAVEYVNSFFKDKAQDDKYIAELSRRANDAGVRSLLIMIDGEGHLGAPDAGERTKAVKSHHKWVQAARRLGCHSIRVNARSRGEADEQRDLAADGLRRLSEYAGQFDINVLVENHGELSSNGKWLASVMRQVDLPNCGTLPDFGNFLIDIERDEWYDRYQGVEELMPFAKAVSAKSHDFDDEGNETRTDYRRMMRIVLDAGYRGFVGIEYEGERLGEVEGVQATKRLLERVRAELTPGK